MTETQSSILTNIWAELAAAVDKKDHAWRTPVLATSNRNGRPATRTVVLRDVDADKWQCQFYTDKRSAKCQQIQAEPTGELLFWCPDLKWQLRAEVDYQLLTSGQLVEQVWQKIAATPAANDYLSLQPPGSELHTATNATAYIPNLAVIIATIKQIDWLALTEAGHQRALLSVNSFQRLVP
ncbi:MAG TPA: pyridoxamine 5'-phosphate oxidase family protein [Methylophaga sp.]|nr:pyridoxamine 5'-phosphate oxidase family protein [Methylophaga sp.]